MILNKMESDDWYDDGYDPEWENVDPRLTKPIASTVMVFFNSISQ